jgi:hypothetical protein
MTNQLTGIFVANDEIYEKLGIATTPVVKNSKKPAIKNWQSSGALPPEERWARRQKFIDANIGVLAGADLPTGRTFGFIDVDHPGWVGFIKAVLATFVSGKIGAKGLTTFCQVDRGIKSSKLRAPAASAPAVEIFADSGQTVVPPSKHPSGCDYRWEGKPLPEIKFEELPVLDSVREAIIKAVVQNKHAWEIVEGGAEVKAHQAMLSLTSSGIASLTDDLEWLAVCLDALFDAGYQGNTAAETLSMLKSAEKKKLGNIAGDRRSYDPGGEGPIPLGFTKDGQYAFRDQVRRIIVLASANQLLSMQYLLGLAPSKFWGAKFPSEKSRFDFFRAGEALISSCKSLGPFNPLRVRGRGIWREGELTIINLGVEVVSSAQFHYICFEPIELGDGEKFETSRLLEYLQRFHWRNEQDAMLLLGWLAMAPICGVLNWRPHCFLYGPPRCGKTTIHTLAARLPYPLVISTDGQSSEAGIRQMIGPDSLPVIIDEFESDHQGAGLRGVLRLARSASSADNPVLRGTPEGKAMQFSLRTTFFFCAVNPGRMSPADQSRILVFEMLAHDGDEATARKIIAEEAYFRSLGPSWCSYMIKLASILEPAFDVFEPVMPSSDRRQRQNIGTLLAAAFLALNGRLPSAEEAEQWANEYSPAVERHAEDAERDNSAECLEHLLAHVVDDYPLGHWMALALAGLEESDDRYFDVERISRTFDFRARAVDNKWAILIRNGSPNIEEIYRNTLWEGRGWERALHGLEGSFALKDPVYFKGTGQKSRCIGIPSENIPDPIETPPPRQEREY